MESFLMEVLTAVVKGAYFLLQCSPVLGLVVIQRQLLKKEKKAWDLFLPVMFGVLAAGATLFFMKDFSKSSDPNLIGFVSLFGVYLVFFNIPTMALVLTNVWVKRQRKIRREQIQMSVKEL